MNRAAYVTIGSVLMLLAFGLVMLYSVSPLDEGGRHLAKQSVAAALGFAGASLLALIDYRRLRGLAWWLLALAVVLLILVLVAGVKVNGARRWFRLPGVQFQPSDLAKLALLVALAHYGATWQRLMRTFHRGFLVPALIIGPVVGLIFLEPDWGTALLLASVSAVVLLVAGLRLSCLLCVLLVGAAGLLGMIKHNEVRGGRVHSWLHLEQTKDAVGYQAWQARLALGSGGVTGKGLNNSTQKGFIPEQRTDFIFAVVGEEFGYVGSIVMITLFLALFLSGLWVAAGASDTFGTLLGVGLSFLLGMQALLNLAVVSGAVPNKGITLPFISAGGTNLMMMLFCAGILVSIARHSGEQPEQQPDQPLVPVTQIA